MRSAYVIVGSALISLVTASWQPAVAQDEEEEALGWSAAAELSFVMTSGNSESTTLGFNGNADRKWSNALLGIKLAALKVESTTTADLALGTGQGDFTVPEVTATTAENYAAVAKYDRNISKRFFWYVAGGWLRNEFAGIQDRYVVSGGVGNTWFDKPKFSFRSNYGVSYTNQDDVVESPLVETKYAGLLVATNLKKKFGKSKSEYGNDFVFNYSLQDSDNWRWTMDQYVATSLTEVLALKVSLVWLYNNVPAFIELPLFDPNAADPTQQIGTVIQQLDELDTVFSVSLVVNF